MRRIWWLNFDAERELANPSARTTPRKVSLEMEARARRFAPRLCEGEPFLVPGGAASGIASVQRSDSQYSDSQHPSPHFFVMWCPTPGALQAAAELGFDCPAAPPADVLRRINDRRFAWSLLRSAPLQAIQQRLTNRYPATIPFVQATRWCALPTTGSSASASRATEFDGPETSTTHSSEPLRLKRFFGFAGRGQRRIDRWPPEASDVNTERWLAGAQAQGGYMLEPEVSISLEMSLHGLVTETMLQLGDPCIQRCDEFGAPLSIERAPREPCSSPGDSSTASLDRIPALLDESLRDAGSQVGLALRQAGYFGPFGIDARLFRWREELGVHLIGDLNARFTLGWSIGMGPQREAALDVLRERCAAHS